jgi:uroporphyrinogen decarboxylase
VKNDRLVKALRREPVDRTPVWFMRQAGRSLPKYRETRADQGMFEIIKDPAKAAEVTALPLEYYPVDACVLYNDLSTPFFGAGIDVQLKAGTGPVIDKPIRTGEDVDRLEPFDPREAFPYIDEQIRILVERLPVPVIAFVGAPFTLCSYLIEGGRGRDVEGLKAFMWREPDAWHRLADYWAVHLAEFGIMQYEAGAAAIQVFDSWAGALSPEDYERYVMPHSRTMLTQLRGAGVPTIHFATGNPALLPLVAEAGGDGIGVDWRLPIDEAWTTVGHDRAIQGNMDPAAMLAGRDVALARARDVLDRVAGRAGHIFNVGHGILPGTDPGTIRAVVDFVHEYGGGQ